MNAETWFARKQIDVKQILAVILAFVVTSFAATSEPSKTSIDGRQYYEIGSPEELAWFGNKVNSGDTAISAILTADIDLDSRNWTPIGKDTTCAFDGIFDGDGHSVSGISVSNKKYAGLFGVLDLGTIKNLTIENSAIRGYYWGEDEYGNYSYGYVGGAVGYAKDKSTIRNVTNRASHIAATNPPTGGATHYFYMGGIVGYTEGNVINCSNEANLTLSGRDYYECIGGIGGTADAFRNKLDSLKNTGEIKGVAITGGIFCATGGGALVTNAINSGTVEGKRRVGGICGDCDVRKSINKGLVKGNGDGRDTLRVGGITGVGFVDSSQNLGDIEIGRGGNVSFVGGISGKSEQVKFSLNYGDVSAVTSTNLYVGGILGLANADISTGWGEWGVMYCGNYGKISASTQTSKDARVGGVVAVINKVKNINFPNMILNVFNQGELHSSHYAAGIAPILPQDSVIIKNFYVASGEIDAPNAAAFVNYNSITSILQHGYLDGTLIENMPLIGENLGVEKELFVVNTRTLQSDSLAYVLELENCGGVRKSCDAEGHWSRDDGYPIIADSEHNPIYQITFVTKNNCSSLNCDADSSKQYTNYKGFVDSIPELTEDYIWVIDNRNFSTLDLKKYVFNWQDTLVVATNQNISSSSSNQTEASSSSGEQSENIVQVKDDLPNCNSKRFDVVYYVEEDDADYKCVDYKWINLSNPQIVSNANIDRIFLPKVFAKERSIQIENMSSGKRIVVLDVQGRIIKKVLASSGMKVSMPYAGRYFVLIGKSITAVDVK